MFQWAIPPVRLGLSGRNSRRIPETLSEGFLQFPSTVRLGSPKPYNSRHLKAPEHFLNSLPPQYGWGRFFFRSGSGEGLSELLSWDSQQYWRYFSVLRANLEGAEKNGLSKSALLDDHFPTCQEVLNPTPLNPTPATCHKRKLEGH